MEENERYNLYKKLRFLITDDFENFRKSMRQMLSSFGAEKIDMAANGNETIARCAKDHYDVLICDFNLGQGKTGQQVLEALRHRKLLRHTSLFVLVTAETSREIVMGAREYHPDTYIIKPITQAEQLLQTKTRYRNRVMQILGDLYLQRGTPDQARTIYGNVLAERELAWGRMGMGRVAMAEAYQRKGNGRRAQEVIQQAIGISPLAILRQKQLADIAASNQDMGRRFKDDESAQTRKQLVAARIHAGQERMEESRKALESVGDRLDADTMTPEEALDYARTLYTRHDCGAAQQVLNRLAARYSDHPDIMKAIEELMDEPVSFRKKNQARTLNREGIKAFENGELGQAADAFKQALDLVPQHPALNLNLVQVLLKNAEQDGRSADPSVLHRCEGCLDQLSHLPPQHRQYKRYQFLIQKIADLKAGSNA